MITVISDRGWVRLNSWDDVVSTPGYVDSVDIKQYQLGAVIGRYVEPEEKACGISTCRRWHNRGYLITTKGGPITHIGQFCGRRHFGVDFVSMARTIEREIELQDKRERLQSIQSQAPGYRDNVDSILYDERGAAWAHKRMRALMGGNPSESITRFFESAGRTGNPDVSVSRRLSQSEVDLMVASGQIKEHEADKEHFTQYSVGFLEGAGAVPCWPELRKILAEDLRPNLEKVSGLKADELKARDLNYWAKWAAGVPGKIERAQAVLNDCRAFLSETNLLQLAVLEPDSVKRREYKALVWKVTGADK